MLSGDLRTFPISDLLQWFDQSRKEGTLEIELGQRRNFWIAVADRRVVGASRPLGLGPGLQRLVPWHPTIPAELLWPDACRDRLLDLFFDSSALGPGTPEGRFAFFDAGADLDPEVPGEDRVAVDFGAQEITLDGLRRLDEWPSLQRTFPNEGAVLAPGSGSSGDESPGQRVILEAARAGMSLAEVRLVLGLSRPALLNRIAPLHEAGRLTLAGSSRGERPDPVKGLMQQTGQLLALRQFDEANHVLQSLLAADVPDPRVAELLSHLEREQTAALYAELSPLATPRLAAADRPRRRGRLSLAEQELLERVNGRLDISALALSSARREIEVLRALRQLVRSGLVEVEQPAPA